jgi:hypothetical protein
LFKEIITMTLQFIHDNRGNTTGVFIPIEEWQSLKTKYTDLQYDRYGYSKQMNETGFK